MTSGMFRFEIKPQEGVKKLKSLEFDRSLRDNDTKVEAPLTPISGPNRTIFVNRYYWANIHSINGFVFRSKSYGAM